MTGPRARPALLTLAILLALYAIVVVRTAWLSDDAYITLRTVDNFIGGYGLRWNADERVQAFTHPLWMFLLAGLYGLTREAYLTAVLSCVVLSLATVALLAWWTYRLDADPPVAAAGLGILVVSRAFVDYSTSGLENALTHLLLVALVAVFLRPRPTDANRLFLLGLFAGLATLNRMDTLLLLLPALAGTLWRAPGRRTLLSLLLGFVPFILWESFSVVYYGFPFPNTAYAKLHTGVSRPEYWRHGLAYFESALIHDPVTLLAITAGVIVGLAGPQWQRRALAAGVALYLLYLFDIGGDFMAGRFLTAPLLVSVMLLLEAAFHVRGTWTRRLLPLAVLFVGCIGRTPTFLAGRDYGSSRHALLDDRGVADERGYYYPATGLLIDTPLTQRPAGASSDMGRDARARRDPLIVDGAVGFPGFFAGPDTYVVDFHALGDPLLARLPMVKSDPLFRNICTTLNGHPCADPWRIGHYLRNIPAGYLDSVLADENRLADANLREFYDALRLITRGPIWSAERWRAIVGMNLGYYDPLLDPGRPVDYQPTQFADTYERFPTLRSVSLLSGAARNYLDRGQPDRAIECYRRLVALDPDSPETWNDLGHLLLERGDAAGGAAALQEAARARAAHRTANSRE